MTKPACMDDAEYAAWTVQNESIYAQSHQAPSPCHDCVTAFALEMRAVDRCDGIPRGVEDDAPERSDGRSFENLNALRLNAEKRHAEREVRIGIALAMFADGMTRRQIAEAMGVRHNTVVRYIKEAAA